MIKQTRNLKSNFLHKTIPYTIFHIIPVALHTIQPILGCQSQYFILHCRQVKQSTQNGTVSTLGYVCVVVRLSRWLRRRRRQQRGLVAVRLYVELVTLVLALMSLEPSVPWKDSLWEVVVALVVRRDAVELCCSSRSLTPGRLTSLTSVVSECLSHSHYSANSEP